jgi:methylglyoxal/glyoxal reductase
MNLSTKITLNNGVDIPILGLGVYRSPTGTETVETVAYALQAGYRHVDTARIYRNEADVVAGVRASGIPREEVFITTKLWESDQGYDPCLAAYRESLRLMGLDIIDLFLIHWPIPHKRRYSWMAMEELLEEGKVRAIGVSNYMVHHLEELLSYARIPPAVNQIELSPYIYEERRAVVEFCRAHGIAVQAYSPLTKGQKLRDPKLVAVAGRYGRTTAQILIRWCLQKGFIVLPKSNRPERILENADVFDFDISAEDIAYLDTFNENLATGWDPAGEP